ncbi:hypothetical protein [Streptomyces sp. HUAS TT3]|uniref:hypothetical protein n=1 Tax=Streptomyces sp. HUAS TT3 TaxID=3447510 RepID=UPI003F65DD95
MHSKVCTGFKMILTLDHRHAAAVRRSHGGSELHGFGGAPQRRVAERCTAVDGDGGQDGRALRPQLRASERRARVAVPSKGEAEG